MQFPNDDETWKKNPLYMDMEEFEEYYEPNENNNQADELMDVPVDLGDYVSIHDQQGLIQ